MFNVFRIKMIERTTREKMYELLEKNTEWKVVDIASSNAGWKYADTFTDIMDHSEYYKKKYNGEKNFVKCDVEKTPFGDKEFDFVIASHILEHVKNPKEFCKEITRIGKRGYIEIPTPLWDNLMDGPTRSNDPYGHKWWVTFDDGEKHIVINKKINIVNKLLSMREHNLHMAWFRDSIITQLYWEDDIEMRDGDGIYKYYDNRDINFVYNTKREKRKMFRFGTLK